MKQILVILGLAISTLSFGQKKSTVDYTVGLQGLVGLKGVSSASIRSLSANGFNFTAECKPASLKEISYTLSVSALGKNLLGNFAKGEATDVQFPVLAGVKNKLSKKLSLGLGAGATFYSVGGSANFTWSPSVNLSHKNWGVSMLMLSTLVDKKLQNAVGVGVSYKL